VSLSVEYGAPTCYGNCPIIAYNVYREGTLLAEGLSENTYTDGGLGLAEAHCYTVTAHDGTYESDPSNEACAATFDCNGVAGGEAFIDDCGNCVGGDTGLDENYAMDCAGVCDGESAIDDCGDCVLPDDFNGAMDCNGVCYGESLVDDCGDCVLPDDFNGAMDCAGVCDGESLVDDCGNCVLPDDFNGVMDCAGVCDGESLVDDCGDCVLPDDFNGAMDCAGVCYGESLVDDCGDCVLPDDFNGAMDCAGVCYGESLVDDCGDCVLPDDFNGAMDCAGVCYGESYTDNCGVCDDDPDNDDLTCSGCMDASAINYDPLATLPDGSCIFEVPVDPDLGAMFETEDGSIIIVIPEGNIFYVDGEVSQEVIITIQQYLGDGLRLTVDEMLNNIPADYEYGDNGIFAFTPFDLVMTEPATLTIPYWSFAGDEASMEVLSLDGIDDTTWALIPGAICADGTCEFTTTTLGLFIVVRHVPGIVDCAGVEDGSAYIDNCGDCVGGTTGLEPCQIDCMGAWGGDAVSDDCGNCVLPADFNAAMDCNGDCDGTAFVDGCGYCVEGNTGLNENYALDCNGVCDGTAIENECGCVAGDTGLAEDFCYGCTDDSATNFDPDATLACNGDNSCCEYVQEIMLYFGAVDQAAGTMEIWMSNNGPEPVAGFQFNVSGVNVTGASGGTADSHGFMVSTNPDGTVLGFILGISYIEPGDEMLTTLSFDALTDNQSCISGAVISGPPGVGALPVVYGDCVGYEIFGCMDPAAVNYNPIANNDDGSCQYGGCTDAGACNFDENADVDDGSCLYLDCNDECGGSAYLDDCSYCVGGSTGLDENYAMDCNGDCDGTAFLDDCAECVSGNTGLDPNWAMDDCGVCFGGNADMDCNGDCFGDAYEDDCGYCVGGSTGLEENFAVDCNGDCDGTAFIDDCGECTGGNTGLDENYAMDCNGDCFGDAVTDDCGYCVGGNTGLDENYAMDCNGDCDGTAFIDDCGNCVSGNTGLDPDYAMDCYGDCDGTAFIDSCGNCVGGNSGMDENYAMDCNGDCDGSAFIDDCAECVGGNTGMDPNWAMDDCEVCFGGNADMDDCGVCFGGNADMDCNGDCFGTAFVDSCGECVEGNTGLTENYAFDDCGVCFGGNADMDCNGDCFGTAFFDQCDQCVGGETGMEEDWAVDDCGVCFGDNADMDCNGDCFGEAFENECGCVGGNTGLAEDVCYGCMDPGAVNFDPDAVFEDGSCIYTMTLETTLLPNQLNNISLFVDPTDPDVENMFAGFDLLLLKDDAGHYYVPEANVNLVGSWILEKGYKIYINGDSELILATDGTLAVPEDHPISLSPFMMNNIAYLRNDALAIADVLADVPVLLVRDDDGHFYAPGVPVNTIDDTGGMQPGSAYEIFLSGMEAAEFTYPAYGTLARTPIVNEDYFATLSEHYEIAKSGTATPIIITDLEGTVEIGDELAAYAHGELVGAARISDLNAPVVIAAWEAFSDYDLELPGYRKGDAIELRLWSNALGRELPVIANLDNDYYGAAPLSTGTVMVTDAAEVVDGFMLTNNYPNPFNPETSFEFVVPFATTVSLDIYDITGRHIRTLVSGDVSSGLHRVVWDGLDSANDPVSAGMYLYTLRSDQVTLTKKMVMMK
ncbi:MAG: T9SS type A sorting domain-containing protein, partial [FCB group bacterium]|nr:T9SS type A sorting domain-containing protein [FCB group bacterium]